MDNKLRFFNFVFTKGLIFFLIISLAGLSTVYGYQRVITFVLMPFMFFYALYQNKFRIYSVNDNYSIIFLGILIWSFLLLIILPLDIENAFKHIIKLLGVYLSILLTYEILAYRKYDFTSIFFISFIFSFYLLSFYLIIGVEIGSISIVSGEYIDRSQFDLNANTYSYFSFFANISLFYLIEIYRKNIYVLFSILTSVLGVYISFITASRSGLLFAIILPVIYWILIFKPGSKNSKLKLILIIFVIIFSFSKLYELYNNSYIKNRVEQSMESGDSREQLAQDAIKVFSENIFTGVGPGQFYLYSFNKSSFSHNSYTEIAANLGIIGVFLIIMLFVRPLLESIKILIITKNTIKPNLLKLNILFFFFFIIYNNFYVFYLTTFGMIFFTIVINIQKKIKLSIIKWLN